MVKRHPVVHQIELRILDLSELFNSMDPTPFHHRHLDRDVEEFLENWALSFPADSRFRIIVYLEKLPEENPEALVTHAIHNYFAYKATLVRRQLRALMIEGRRSLFIGLGFLALTLIGADFLEQSAQHAFVRVLKESLLIGGWVAMWRPLQTFLYDWWPVVRRRKIFLNLVQAQVRVQLRPAATAPDFDVLGRVAHVPGAGL